MLYDPKWEVETGIVTVLRSAKNLIADPRRWTCGEYARDATGRHTDVDDKSAVSFCSVGALAVVLGVGVRQAEKSPACQYLEKAAAEQGIPYAHQVNDKGHAKAMAMFDRAIELAEAESRP